MGIIDKIVFSLHCASCNTSEEITVLDNGSNYGNSHWQSGAIFNKFNVSWLGGDNTEPVITEAACKKCNALTEIKSKYS